MKIEPGQTAVVTGAASGIGRALGVALAKRGCRVALADIDEDGLQRTAELCAAAPEQISTHIVDVADRTRMESFAAEVVQAHGGVQLVVNNAGVALEGTIEELSIEHIEWLVNINLWGVIYGCKFFLPHLRQAPTAHIVNVSSVFGIVGMPSNGPYCATKFAVRGWSESLWTELRGSGIGVTSVHPGGIRTNIARNARTTHAANRDDLVAEFDRVARTSPEHAAKVILRGVERDKLRVRICPETIVLDVLKRLFPSRLHALIGRVFQRRMAALHANAR